MSVRLGNIHARLEHQHTERDPRYPAHEAYDTKDPEKQKDNGGRVVFLDKVENGGADSERNIQDTGNPYELLRKSACHCKIQPRKSKGDTEHENEEDDCVRVEREVVRAAVDAAAVEAFVG